LQAAPSLNTPIAWQDLSIESMLSNAMNTTTVPLSASMQFFRLFRP
jgi:hypothetical protein